MLKIACFGENCVDVNYIDKVIMPGGNCVNAAIYLKELGFDAAYVGTLADDGYGHLIRESLEKFKVDVSMVKTVHGETGVSACRLVDGERTLTMENGGGVVYTDPISVDDKYIAYFKEFDLIHANYWAYLDDELMKISKDTDIPISYDFAQAWDKEKIEKAAGFVKYMLFSGKKELTKEENLSNLYYAVDVCGVKVGIMTFGTEGAYVYNGRKNELGGAEPYFKEPYNSESGAVDTTGCGDAWISGFISTYINGMKQLQGHIGKYEKAGSFLKSSNMEDMESCLIKYSMCVGNMRARATSLLKGAYGCGVTFEEYERKYKR